MIDWLKTRRENRNLKRELRLADGQVETLNEQISDLKKRLKEAEGKADDQGRKLAAARSTTTKLRKQIRDQAAADLLVNALRALGALPAPNNHTDYHVEAQRYNNLMEQQQRALAGQVTPVRGHPAQNQLQNSLGGGMGLFS